MPERDEVSLGVDIGGTKVAAGLVSRNGEILFKTRTAMKSTGTADEALSCVRIAIDSVLSESSAEISSIGLSAPGSVDSTTGTVANSFNVPCWRDYPLGSLIRDAYGLPTRVLNESSSPHRSITP